MNSSTLLRPTAALLVGTLITGGIAWGFLNVPESNALALMASALLAVATIVTAGLTLGLAAALSDPNLTGMGPVKAAARAAVPGFIVGLAGAGVIWWLVGRLDAWRLPHQGEVDAVFIRYLSTTNTGWLWTTVDWLQWAARWVLATALIVCATLGTQATGLAGMARGLGRAFAVRSLATCGIAAIVVGAMWRYGAYWRPGGISTGLEPTFVVVKLAVMAAIAAAVLSAVIVSCREKSATPTT